MLLRTPNLLIAGLALSYTGQAFAHEPAKGIDLVWGDDASDTPSAVVSNRGLVFADTEGDTTSFSLRCNEALEVSTAQPATILPREDGSLLVSTYHGTYVTSDRACSLSDTTGLPDELLTPVVDSSDGTLLATRTTDSEAQVFVSMDQGTSWTQRYLGASGDYFDSFITAPSQPSRVYATGLRLMNMMREDVCRVSDDAGETWETQVVAGEVTPFAVHPTNPDVVFAYQPIDNLATSYRVLRSTDQCASFESVLEDVLTPTGLTGTGDGTLFLGIGGAGGLYRSTDDGASFERILVDQVNSVSCLEQRGDRLWMCANMAPNENGVWFSDDGATTLEEFMTFAAVAQPVSCEDAEARSLCAGPWYDFYQELHPAGADAGVADAGGATDAGSTTGADAATVSDAGSSRGDAGVLPPDADTPMKGGNGGGCSAAPWSRQGTGLSLTSAFLLGLVVWRRRPASVGR